MINLANETTFRSKKHTVYINSFLGLSDYINKYKNNYFLNDIPSESLISNSNKEKRLGIQLSSFFTYSDVINHVISAGYKSRFINRNSLSGVIEESRQIDNVYFNAGANISLWDITTYIGGNLSYQFTSFQDKNVNISPRIAMSKTIKKIGKFNLSLSRSIYTPNQSHLSSFFVEDNKSEYKNIDSFLEREYMTSFNVEHSTTISPTKLKIRYAANIFYNYTKSALGYNGYVFDDLTNVFISNYANLGDIVNYGFHVTLMKSMKDIGYIRISSRIRNTSYFLYDREAYNLLSWNFNSILAFNLPKDLTTEITYSYTNRLHEPYIIGHQKPEINLAVYKDFFDGNLNISFYWDNLFNLNDGNWRNYTARNVFFREKSILRSQTVGFGVSLLIGKELSKRMRSEMTLTSDQIKEN